MFQNKTDITPWYSYKGTYYGKNEPYYYDKKDFKWCTTIENNFEVIKDEILAFIKNEIESINEYFNTDIVKGKNKWKVGSFYFWGKRNSDYCNQIPEVEKILTAIPGFVSAGISILEPNTEIEPHNGDTDASVRVHIPIIVPDGLPKCGFKVGDEERAWEEGRVLIFNDAQKHSAWNYTDKKRYLLIIDVVRPELLDTKSAICANANSLIALQELEYKHPFIKKLPGPIRSIIRHRLKSKFLK